MQIADRLTRADLTRLLHRLATAYGRPFGSRAEDQVAEYYRVLSWASLAELTTAVDRWIAARDRWPVPAALAAAAREARRQQRPAEPVADATRCPGCQQPYAWRAWYVQRRSLHDRRPVAVEYEQPDGTVHPLLQATRLLCDCGYAAVLRSRAHVELAADRENPFALAELRRRANLAAAHDPGA